MDFIYNEHDVMVVACKTARCDGNTYFFGLNGLQTGRVVDTLREKGFLARRPIASQGHYPTLKGLKAYYRGEI